ncbi:MAG: hypothetical protein Q7S08_05055 [bacterium]|nr:hypothetical protein [bacterium]
MSLEMNPFHPSRPSPETPSAAREREDNAKLETAVTQAIKNTLIEWRKHPGKIVPLTQWVGTKELGDDKLTVPTVVDHLSAVEQPKRSIEELNELSLISINMNALGERQDSVNRANVGTTPLEKQFLEFLTSREKDASIICLQDFPLYRLKVLGPQLHKMGFSYYANVCGVDGKAPGHLMALVTLVNTRSQALDGYAIDMPELSITPHMQGSHKEVKVVRTKDGEEHAVTTYPSGEPPFVEAYGSEARGWAGPHTYQTLNAKFRVMGMDGHARTVVISNIYMSPASYMVERNRSVRTSLKNSKSLAGKNGVAVFIGDMNTYGYDAPRAIGRNPVTYFPLTAGLSALEHFDLLEVKHMRNLASKLGFQKGDIGSEPTVTRAAGMVGMQLDHAFARGVKEITANPPIPVTFTDHKALETFCTF